MERGRRVSHTLSALYDGRDGLAEYRDAVERAAEPDEEIEIVEEAVGG